MSRYSTRSWAVREALARRESFTTYGALRAIEGATSGYANTGQLPEEYAATYRQAAGEGRITYTVLSYRTPIAWVLDDGTVVEPPVKYSVTTSKHQGLLYALGQEADGYLSDRAATERQAARERAAQARERAAEARERARGRLVEREVVRADASRVTQRLRLGEPPATQRVDYAPVRMEYSESYSVRQGWATSYDVGPASGVLQDLSGLQEYAE